MTKNQKMSATSVKAEALKILTAPGAECDPFEEGVKRPEMMLQMIKEVLEDFLSKNPHLQHDPAELAAAFLHDLGKKKT